MPIATTTAISLSTPTMVDVLTLGHPGGYHLLSNKTNNCCNKRHRIITRRTDWCGFPWNIKCICTSNGICNWRCNSSNSNNKGRSSCCNSWNRIACVRGKATSESWCALWTNHRISGWPISRAAAAAAPAAATTGAATAAAAATATTTAAEAAAVFPVPSNDYFRVMRIHPSALAWLKESARISSCYIISIKFKYLRL